MQTTITTFLSPVLAQNLPNFGGANVVRIPPAPLLERYLYEQPWSLMAVCIIAAVAAAYVFTQKRRARFAITAILVGLCLAGLNWLSATFVTTVRERCRELTKRVVAYTLAGDSASLSPLLRSDVIVRPFALSRERLLDAVSTRMRSTYAVNDSSILSLAATIDSPGAVRTQIHLRVTPQESLYAVPTGSWWILTWQRHEPGGPNAWLLTQIECQQIDGVGNPSTINP